MSDITPKQNPFSLYDFLGYFTPGAIFIYGGTLAYIHENGSTNIINDFLDAITFNNAGAYIPFILISYVMGHILNFISSITIERYSIWSLGYPSKFLLGMNHDGYYFTPDKKIQRRILRTIIFLLLAPISIYDLVLGKWFDLRSLYAKKLDPVLAKLIKAKVGSLMTKSKVRDMDIGDHNASDIEYFIYAYHYAVENTLNHLPKMQNYVALFGFLRVICLISLVFPWFIFWHFLNGLLPFCTFLIYWIPSSAISFILYMGFLKFYSRFTLETLMAMAVTIDKNP